MSHFRQLLPPCTVYAILSFLFLIAIPELLLAAPDTTGVGELRLLGARGSVDTALLREQSFNVRVHGLVARVTVHQVFENTRDEWLEGEYVFPLATGSAVDYLAMKIGERVVVGEIREKQIAEKQYQEARAAGKKASLVTQQRPNLFTNRVANIGPGETILVELQYVQTLHYDQGRFSLRLPTTLTPRYIPGQAFAHFQSTDYQKPPVASSGWALPTDQVPDADQVTPPMVPASLAAPLRVHATIDAGLPLDNLRSLHHPASVSESGGRYLLDLNDGASLNRDVVLEWTPRTGRTPVAALFHEQVADDDFLLLMLMPPQQMPAGQRLPREVIYLVDTSGSMGGASIQQARAALDNALVRLQPADRFNVIEFNSGFSALWPAAVGANPANVAQARHFVQTLTAQGGTNMAPALQRALLDDAPVGYVRQVVFITDGSVGNEHELLELIEARRGDSRVFTVAIGSAPNGYFMEQAARAGRGSYTYIASQAEVGTRMADLFHKLENPVVTDIQWDFQGHQAEVFPARAPDLYAGEPLVLTARLDSTIPDTLTLRGQANGNRFQQQFDLRQGRSAESISTVWARHKLARLDEQERNSQRSAPDLVPSIRDAIVQLALQHRLLSRYTAFIAIEDRVSRPPQWMLERVAVPNAMPAGSTQPVPSIRPAPPLPGPPPLLAAIPMPQGGLGLRLDWLIVLLSLLAMMLSNARHLPRRQRGKTQ